MSVKMKERHTEQITPKFDDLKMPELDEVLQLDADIVKPTEEELQKHYLDALAFNEEPLKIRLEPSSEENPPMYVDCWVQGKPCEMFDTTQRRWIQVGAFPVSTVLITRRKYVEALARSRKINVRTMILNPTAERPENRLVRTVTQRNAITIIQDNNPKGQVWWNSLMAF